MPWTGIDSLTTDCRVPPSWQTACPRSTSRTSCHGFPGPELLHGIRRIVAFQAPPAHCQGDPLRIADAVSLALSWPNVDRPEGPLHRQGELRPRGTRHGPQPLFCDWLFPPTAWRTE